MDEKELKLRSYLKERFANYEDSIGSEDSLEGIVDSLGLFDLVAFLEEEFAISIPNEDFSPDLFSTIEKILLLLNGDQPR
ncbi:MAG: acyl carrier protein [Syntrophorhabdus sp.]